MTFSLMSAPKKYGWFSAAYCSQVPYTLHVYLRPDGSNVTVCGVLSSEDPPASGWRDAVMVGEVTRHVNSYEVIMPPPNYAAWCQLPCN